MDEVRKTLADNLAKLDDALARQAHIPSPSDYESLRTALTTKETALKEMTLKCEVAQVRAQFCEDQVKSVSAEKEEAMCRLFVL